MSENLDRFNENAFRSRVPFSGVDRAMLDLVQAQAKKSPLKRSRICCHQSSQDSPQEMLICLEPGTYIRPHRHFNRAESGLVLQGTADALFFDEGGQLTDAWPMGLLETGRRFFYRIQEPVFHCLVVTEGPFIFHEVSTGPHDPAESEFASWSPDASLENEVGHYLTKLKAEAEQFYQTCRPS